MKTLDYWIKSGFVTNGRRALDVFLANSTHCQIFGSYTVDLHCIHCVTRTMLIPTCPEMYSLVPTMETLLNIRRANEIRTVH